MASPPKVFISYTWEDEAHNEWVEGFAAALRAQGVDATIDKWELVPGAPLPAFMEKQIRESLFVLLICTPVYKTKYDERKGGAGFEAHLVGGDTLVHGRHEKFIPILRLQDQAESIPSAHHGKMYVDLRSKDSLSGENYKTLVRHLHGAAPVRGGPPVVPFVPTVLGTSPVVTAAPSTPLEHDRQIFARLDGILDESQFCGLVDWIGDQGWVRDSQRTSLDTFADFISLTQNGFLDVDVETAKSGLQEPTQNLLSFMSTHFFRRDDGPKPTSDLMYLYPDLNLDLNPIATTEQQALFHRRTKELGALCDQTLAAYRAFRSSVKRSLFV